MMFVFSFIGAFIKGIKETFEPSVPAENWASQDLYHQDIMNGVSVEQRMRWAQEGRYKRSGPPHPEPHRDPASGQIIIENNLLFEEDKKKYGVVQAYKWAEEGRYNLNPEELEIEHRRIERELLEMYELMDCLSDEQKKRLAELRRLAQESE